MYICSCVDVIFIVVCAFLYRHLYVFFIGFLSQCVRFKIDICMFFMRFLWWRVRFKIDIYMFFKAVFMVVCAFLIGHLYVFLCGFYGGVCVLEWTFVCFFMRFP